MIIKKGFKKTDIGEIPVDWEVKNFGEVTSKIIGGGTPSRANPAFWGKEIPWVTVKDFATFNKSQTQEYITKEGLKNSASNLIPKGTLITSTRMALGKSVIYDVDVSINQDLKAIFPNNELTTNFLYYWFQFNSKKIEELGSGSTVMGISLPDLKAIQIPLPPLPEQKAIAKVLSDMDNLITALEVEIEKMRLVKQGAMQELLSAGDDWEVRILGEVCELTSSKRVFEHEYVKNGVPFYRGKEISLLLENKEIHKPYFISIEKYNSFKRNYGVPQKGDILITAVGTLGNSYLIPNNDKFYFKDGNLIWLRNIKYVNPQYLHIQLENHKQEIISNAIGSSQKALTIVVLKSQKIPLPPLSEQTRIAKILTDIDLTIGSKEVELGKYRAMKVGLMQELLSGKRRLVRG